jgi:hypothetical protein
MKLVAPCIDADETPLLFCEKRVLFPTSTSAFILVFVATLLLLLSSFAFCAEINHRAVSPSAILVSFSFSESCNAKKSSLKEDDDEEAKTVFGRFERAILNRTILVSSSSSSRSSKAEEDRICVS